MIGLIELVERVEQRQTHRFVRHSTYTGAGCAICGLEHETCQADDCYEPATVSDSRRSLAYCAIHYRLHCETEQEQERRLGYSESARLSSITGGQW